MPAAGAAFAVSPDGSYATTIESPDFVVIAQRRGGLDISEAAGVCSWSESSDSDEDVVLDRKGDKFANGGEYNRRHHKTNRATRDAMAAVAIGSVVQGDKDAKDKTSYINETGVPDLVEIGGDEATGGDVCVETKVPSPLTQSRSAGKGSRKKGGKPASVGHLYAFGNTEEFYRVRILGCKQVGHPKMAPFDHTTGKGYVEGKAGQYADALRKGSRVISAIVETFGGITPHFLSYLSYLARRAKGRHGRDSTVYGRSRTSARSFFTHHTQRIGLAAQVGDAQAIRRSVRYWKQCAAGAVTRA